MKNYVVESNVQLVFKTKIYRESESICDATHDVENILISIIEENEQLNSIIDDSYEIIKIISKTSKVNNIQ